MNEHKDHRKRLKSDYFTNGLDSFEDHKALELLLFYSIPRIDTNVIAHRLIARFGSYRGVLTASYDELLEVDGIGEESALFLRLFADSCRRFELSDRRYTERFMTVDKVGTLLRTLYSGKTREEIYVLMFNGRMEMIGMESIAIGSFSSASVSAGTLVELALKNRAAGIVLAHNHPSGVCLPSGDDITLTSQLEHLCSQMGVSLLEHFIIADDDYFAIMHGKQFGKE